MASDPEAAVPLSHLWRIAGEGMAGIFRDGPGFEATGSPEHWTVIGGEPRVIFNWLAIHTAHPDNEARLRAGVAAFRARRLPALVVFAEALAAGLAPVARELGLESADPVPLMLLRPNRPATRPSPPGLVVERVRDADRVAGLDRPPRRRLRGIGRVVGPLQRPQPARGTGPVALPGPGRGGRAQHLLDLARWAAGLRRGDGDVARPPAARRRPGGPDPRPDRARRDGRDGRLLDRVRRGTPAL